MLRRSNPKPLAGQPLTSREAEVVTRLSMGYGVKQIASQLGLATRTVEIHRHRAMRKVSAQTSVHMCVMFVLGMNAAIGEPMERTPDFASQYEWLQKAVNQGWSFNASHDPEHGWICSVGNADYIIMFKHQELATALSELDSAVMGQFERGNNATT